MIEKEIRYEINEKIEKRILEKTEKISDEENVFDIVLGKNGFESLKKNGYIVRIRKNNRGLFLETKERMEDNTWQETKVPINEISEIIKILSLLGLDIYLYINRTRRVRKYKNLIICLDEVEMLGKYVEIEFQNSSINEAECFLQEVGINGTREELYGDIIKSRILNDKNFKTEFDKKIASIKK